MRPDTTSQEFFDRKYRDAGDPWQFASSDYEQHRYEVTIKALKHRSFDRAFEPGCSIGLLTARLAKFCDVVEASDISPTAIDKAREHCSGHDNIHFTVGSLPAAIPSGSFDLIVFSEIGYYFDEDQLLDLTRILSSRLRKPGTLLAVHWLGNSEDHILSGDRVHELLGTITDLDCTLSQREPGFRLDRWDRI